MDVCPRFGQDRVNFLQWPIRYHRTSLKGTGVRDASLFQRRGKSCGGKSWLILCRGFFCVNSLFVLYLLLLIWLLLLSFSYLTVLCCNLLLSRPVISPSSLPPDGEEGGHHLPWETQRSLSELANPGTLRFPTHGTVFAGVVPTAGGKLWILLTTRLSHKARLGIA